MMYDKLIKWLRSCSTQAAPCKTCEMIVDACCTDTLMTQAADAVEELSRAQERWIAIERNALLNSIPRWIPVTERLPDSCGHYFVFIIGGGIGQISWETTAFFDGKIFRWEHMGQEYPEDVTHWMPLPEPPKEET